jgi:biotin-dependent carboxylase-like uncharacterized protein
MIDVVRVGLAATIQDGGRVGWAHLGVPRSGALDEPALRRANRRVGNPAGAAGIEITLRGIRLRFTEPAVVAVSGAPAPVEVDGVPVTFATAVEVAAGQVVAVGPARAGIRTYLAVAGGIDVPAVLGSRSTDSLSGLGPPPLVAGCTLGIGSERGPVAEEPEPSEPSGDVTVRIRFGPRDDWFTAAARAAVLGSAYQVTALSNRVGARLAGPNLTRANLGEMPSEPVVLGAVQVLPDGQPLIFLADHPTTGGYPVIGVVSAPDLARIAQLRPGGTVRFELEESRGSQR